MDTAPTTTERFLPLGQVASRLGIPVAWLKAEAAAGRVPHLRVSRNSLLLRVSDVEQSLLERARNKEFLLLPGEAANPGACPG